MTLTRLTSPAAMTFDEILFRLHGAIRLGRLTPDDWGFAFTLSLMKHAKRRDWAPTSKQLAAARKLVADLRQFDAEYGAEPSLIDYGDEG